MLTRAARTQVIAANIGAALSLDAGGGGRGTLVMRAASMAAITVGRY
jgi:hypothetical protein